MNDHMDAATAAKVREARTFRGEPPDQPLPDARSLGDLLRRQAEATPDKEFLIFYDEAGERTAYSYRRFHHAVRHAAAAMADLGLRVGDRVATVGYNHTDTVILYFAAWMLGLTVVPINVNEDDERVAFILSNAECKVAFARAEYLPRVAALRDGAPTLRALAQVGGGEQLPEADALFVPLPAGEGEGDGGELPSLDDVIANVDATQEALIVYTSGTTGAPKGVLLSQTNLLADARGVADWHRMTAEQRMMCVLPIHHVNGILVTLVTPLLFGGSTVLCRAFSPRRFWQRLADERVQVVSVVPTLLAFLLEANEALSRYDLSAFRHFICGAGPLTVGLACDFEARFGQTLIHGYGLSETTCYSCFLPLDLDAAEHHRWLHDWGYPSIGVPIAPNEMAIHDEQGRALPPGPDHKGEIVIRGHNVMLGYFRRPDANASTFAHGWFRSGDEGFWVSDAQGRPFFFITGRLKELIIRGGVNYSPFEIDEVLTAIPGVRVGLAVGFPNKYYGEEVGAYIVLEEGSALGPDEILRRARATLPFSKCPKVVVFGDTVPVTSTGKYQRLRLAPLFADHEERQFRE